MNSSAKTDADLIVVGGGAAGFFGAIQAAEQAPNLRVILLEKSSKLLSKVRISGGGRCNVTNAERDHDRFAASYPRGDRWMRKLLYHFGPQDTCEWFAKHGVELVAEPDGRMFPLSNTSASVVDCLLHEADRLNIDIRMRHGVQHIEKTEFGFLLKGADFEIHTRFILLATGGFPKAEDYRWLQDTQIEIEKPVPSLFTFNFPREKITELMGVSTEAVVRLPEAKVQAEGPLLITHWGISGPAVLRCSAFGATKLAALNYQFQPKINWLPGYNAETVFQVLTEFKEANLNKKKTTRVFPEIPQRLWNYLLEKAGLNPEDKWSETKSTDMRKLSEMICNDVYRASGKTTFKEEFVTAGGVKLNQLNHATCEHKEIKGLYFAGELLNADGITGGFNFQHAWTTGFVAGTAIAEAFRQPSA